MYIVVFVIMAIVIAVLLGCEPARHFLVDYGSEIDLVIKATGVIAGGLLIHYTAKRSKALEDSATAASKQAEIAARGQTTERFSRAVDQLGSGSRTVQVGAIFALERVARDAPELHWSIMETLASFIRQHAPRAFDGKQVSEVDEPGESNNPPEEDVQAALTVIGRRDAENDFLDCSDKVLREKRFIDLKHTNLASADFYGGNFARANFGRAYLVGANFTAANLQNAKFTKNANIGSAFLERANLRGCDLSETDGLNWQEISKATGDEQTRLPGELESADDNDILRLQAAVLNDRRPEHWPARLGISRDDLIRRYDERKAEIDA